MDQRDETLASLGEVNDQLMAKNHALAKALSRATQELTKAKAQLNQLAGPPMTFATMVRVHSSRTDEQGVQHASAEVISGSRRMIVPVAANVQASRLEAGRTVLLNENMVVVSQAGTDAVGAVRTVKQVIDDGRLLVADGGGNVALVRRSGALSKTSIDPPAVSAAVWAGMAAVRGASAVHGVRDSAHPDASRDASVACVFLGFRAVCGIRLLCRHLSCRRASRAAPYACYALRSYSSLLPSIARM